MLSVIVPLVYADAQADLILVKAPFLGRLVVDVTGDDLHRTIHFPRLLSNSLVVYSLVPIPADHCSSGWTTSCYHVYADKIHSAFDTASTAQLSPI